MNAKHQHANNKTKIIASQTCLAAKHTQAPEQWKKKGGLI
jgi:hypothetical protein